MDKQTIQEIRQKERISHIQAYSNQVLFRDGWLRKPVKTVMDLLPMLDETSGIRVLDLGCGVGRNAIPIAKYFCNVPCHIDCVDLLDLATEQLLDYADKFEVKNCIHSFCVPIEAFPIPEGSYDFILAVSSLEHIDGENSFCEKLHEIRNGLKPGGIVCLIVNSQVSEQNSQTGDPLIPQFEVNFPTSILLELLQNCFSGWTVLRQDIQHQQYLIPRDNITSLLSSNVITFAAQK